MFGKGIPDGAAQSSAVAEVVGDTGLLIDPNSRTEITAGLSQMLAGGSDIANMVTNALDRAEQYTWTNSARQTSKIYRQVLERY